MAPIVSPRTIARAFATAALDPPSSPFQSIPRQSQPSSHSSSPLKFRRGIAAASHLVSRLNDNANIVPETYGSASNGPDAGTVVGIVLGSVGGFLLILWLIYTITNLGNGKQPQYESATVDTASVMTRKSRRRRHSQSRRSASTRPRETVETIRRERVVPVPMPMPMPAPQTERIIVEERTHSRAPGPPPPMPPPPPRVVQDDDDEVVVIEENSPPRRRESKHHRRRSSRRSSERRSDSRPGGYREVDPYRYAGGNASVRSVSRRRSPSRGGY